MGCPGGSRAASPPPAAGPVDPWGSGPCAPSAQDPTLTPRPVRRTTRRAAGSPCGRPSWTGWQPRRAVRTGGRRERHGADDPAHRRARARSGTRRRSRRWSARRPRRRTSRSASRADVPRRHPDVAGEVARALPGTEADLVVARACGRARAPPRRARPARTRPSATPAASASTRLPPRRRRAAAVDGQGTTSSGPAPTSERSPPAARLRGRAANGRVRSSRPRSFQATTARRTWPVQSASVHTGSGPRPSSRSSRGARSSHRHSAAARRRAHDGHHATSSSPQPAHSTGTSRPSSSRSERHGRSMRADGAAASVAVWTTGGLWTARQPGKDGYDAPVTPRICAHVEPTNLRSSPSVVVT